MKQKRLTRILAFGLSGLMVTAAIESCRKCGDFLVRDDLTGEKAESRRTGPVRADAIVMLMGSISDRILQVADLYGDSLAPRVLMVEQNVSARDELAKREIPIEGCTDLAVRNLVRLGVPENCIRVISGNAASTQMEAVKIMEWLRTQPGTDTLVLVSSSYHMRRASMIFRAASRSLDQHVQIYCSPSRYSGFNSARWWKDREDIQAVASEYLKMVYFLVFDKRKL